MRCKASILELSCFTTRTKVARILSIDYGKKRTGLAVTDPLQIIAGGLATVPTAQLYEFVEKYIKENDV